MRTDTATTSFRLAYLPVRQQWCTWRQDGTHQALLEMHATRVEALKRLSERVSFQREVESMS